MSLFSRYFAYPELERQRDELRERVRQLETENKLLIDAFARAANKPEVFNRPPPVTSSEVPGMAIGPTAVAARRALKEKETEAQIFARAESARDNGGPAIPEIPSK